MKSPTPIFAQLPKRKPPAVDFPIPYQAQLEPVFYYTMATFTPYIGGIFTSLGQRGQDVELQLVSVSACGVQPKTKLSLGKQRESNCFALLFSAAQPLTELTTIHRIKHGALGQFDLFMTRSEDERGRFFYLAIINHVV